MIEQQASGTVLRPPSGLLGASARSAPPDPPRGRRALRRVEAPITASDSEGRALAVTVFLRQATELAGAPRGFGRPVRPGLGTADGSAPPARNPQRLVPPRTSEGRDFESVPWTRGRLTAIALLMTLAASLSAQEPVPDAARPETPPAAPEAQEAPAPEAELGPGDEPAPVLDGRSGSELFTAGMAAAEAGETERALGLLEGAVTRAPDNLRYGAEYRQVVIAAGTYDRALALFKQLAEEHPGSPNLLLNDGYAHVDKIPAAGAITQVILANTSLTLFTRSLEAGESWLARYTRGNSYVYWPPIFGRLPAGIADLEQAVAQAEEREKRSYQALAYAALGDGYWRSGEPERARGIWARGLERFPGDQRLLRRAEASDEEIETLFEEHYNPNTRVDTTLRELWRAGWQEACDCNPEAGE